MDDPNAFLKCKKVTLSMQSPQRKIGTGFRLSFCRQQIPSDGDRRGSRQDLGEKEERRGGICLDGGKEEKRHATQQKACTNVCVCVKEGVRACVYV